VRNEPEFFVSVGPKQPGEGWCLFLGGREVDTVSIGPFENQSVAEELTEKVEKYLGALVQAVEQCE